MGEQIPAQQAMSCSKIKLRNFLVFSRFTCNSQGRSLVMITLVAQKKGGTNKQNLFEKKEVFEKVVALLFMAVAKALICPS